MPQDTIAVSVASGPQIRLRSGAWFDLLDPASSEFTIDDIAHGLAHTCRYAGQADGFYSVAEHSILVSEVALGHEYAALLHDAAEAFIGDVTRPLKQLLPEYKRLEKSIEEAIFARFDVGCVHPDVKKADLEVLAAEQAQLMPEGTDAWANEAGISAAPVRVERMAPAEAKLRFLERYHILRQSLVSAHGSPRPIEEAEERECKELTEASGA